MLELSLGLFHQMINGTTVHNYYCNYEKVRFKRASEMQYNYFGIHEKIGVNSAIMEIVSYESVVHSCFLNLIPFCDFATASHSKVADL